MDDKSVITGRPYNPTEELRSLIARSEELHRLYGDLGYSASLDIEVRKLKARLEVEVTIPDFQRFQEALDEAIQHGDHQQTDGHSQRGRNLVHNGWPANLCAAVMAVRHDLDSVIELLNQPGRGHLPVRIEDVAVFRRPRDPEAFRAALLDLRTRLEAEEEIYRRESTGFLGSQPSLQETIEELCQALDANARSVADELSEVFGALEKHVQNVGDEKKGQLDGVLLPLLEARHRYKPAEASFISYVRHSVRTYLDSPWMQGPWMTAFLLNHLCEGEITRLEPKGLSDRAALINGLGPLIVLAVGGFLRWTPSLPDFRFVGSALLVVGVAWLIFLMVVQHQFGRLLDLAAALRRLLHPVMGGVFDGRETARRLRDLERQGIHVDSLLFPLLELQVTSRGIPGGVPVDR